MTLNLGCLLIWAGVYIEKGMGLIIPGMTPDTLGQIYEYKPTIGYVVTGTLTLSDKIYMRPRVSDSITRVNS